MENSMVDDASSSIAKTTPELPSEESSHITLAVLAEKNQAEDKNILEERNTQRRKKTPPLFWRKIMERSKKATPPNPVRVPPAAKIFGYPERYMSPTDSIISPVSRGLLDRNKRLMRPVPAFVPPKVLDESFQDLEHGKLETS